jgi:hypothetical protein
MKRVKDQMKAAVKKSDYHYGKGRETFLAMDTITGDTPENRTGHRKLSKKYGKKATALRKFTERDKKFR